MSYEPTASTVVESHKPECGPDMKKRFGEFINISDVVKKGWPESCAKITYTYNGKSYTASSYTTQRVGEGMSVHIYPSNPDHPMPVIDEKTLETRNVVIERANEGKNEDDPDQTKNLIIVGGVIGGVVVCCLLFVFLSQ